MNEKPAAIDDDAEENSQAASMADAQDWAACAHAPIDRALRALGRAVRLTDPARAAEECETAMAELDKARLCFMRAQLFFKLADEDSRNDE